jgi:uncharacterized protein
MLLLLSGLSFLVLLTGCEVRKPVLPMVPSTAHEAQADAAWRSGEYALSEQLYRELLLTGQIPGGRQDVAWERLIESALRAGHDAAAIEDLRRWGQLRPSARERWSFHQNHLWILLDQDQPGLAKRHLGATLSDPDLPREVRASSGRALAALHWDRNELQDALGVLEATYPLCPGWSCREEMESDLMARLAALEPTLLEMLHQVSPAPEAGYRFPGLQLNWQKQLVLLEEHPERWASILDTLEDLLEKGRWENATVPRATHSHLTARFGTTLETGVCLLIPLSGPFAQVGWKIASGAEMARAHLAAIGVELNVRLINSESDGWTEKVRTLPRGYDIVGGPVRSTILREAAALDLTAIKPFFAFMPTLNEVREGNQAWRFFGGPDDQVAALLNWTSGQLGITSYGVLYPDDRYGLGMSRFFWQGTTQSGGKVTALQSYPTQESRGWGRVVQGFLSPPKAQPGQAGRPDPDFEAVFLPDTLSNAKLIVPQFHFYDESRLVFLGTELWTQGWGAESSAEARYFQLALMPGAWWEDNPAPAARELRRLCEERGETADFWVALGYDFTRFASTLGPLPRGWVPREVNRLLAQPSTFSWSLAPLRWDFGGMASQEMFVLTPGRRGLVLADPQRIQTTLDEARRRHQERLESGRVGQSHRKATDVEVFAE